MKFIIFFFISLVCHVFAAPHSNVLTKRLNVQCPRFDYMINAIKKPVKGYARDGDNLLLVFASIIGGKGFQGLPPDLGLAEKDYDDFTDVATKGMKKLFGLEISSADLAGSVTKIQDVFHRASRIEKSSVVVKCDGNWLNDKDEDEKEYSGPKPPSGKEAYWSNLHNAWIFAQPSAKCPDGLQGTLVQVDKKPKVVMVLCPMIFYEEEYAENEPFKTYEDKTAESFDNMLNARSTVTFHEYLHNAGLKDSTKDGKRLYSYKDITDYVKSNPKEATKDVQNHLFFALGAYFAFKGFDVDWETGMVSYGCG